MIGTFVTAKFVSRADYERNAPTEVLTSTNRFTDAGLMWMWQMMSGQLRNADGTVTDHLGSARLLVGNGSREFEGTDQRLVGPDTAQAELDPGMPTIVGMVQGDEGRDACRIVFRATFGEDAANFEWAERGVVSAQGVLLDRSVEDQGRKVLGQIWTLEASLDIDR